MIMRSALSFGNNNGNSQNTLTFKNIHLTHGDREILCGIHGEISSQNILALMGPSGSGKSSLLNVLSFRRELLGEAVSSGCIMLNDVSLSKKDRCRIGYVMQEDIFFPMLTLYETLTFYVNLRVSNKYSQEEKEAMITKLARNMHLENCMNTIMGGGIIRGLSGGERKRASVACELITDPVILMLDEPTSGLDSFMAANVINILKDYCRTRNKIVIASIHQPSSQTFHCFDHLVLLASGKLVYEGSTHQVSNFFAECGFQCPQQWNIADYMLEVVSSNEQSMDKIVNKFKILGKGKFNSQHKDNNTNDDQTLAAASLSNEIMVANQPRKKWPAGKLAQFKCLVWRNFLLSIEDQLSLLSLSKSVLIALLLGSVWFNLQWDESHFQDILVETEKLVISKERMASMYSLLLYYVAKVLGEVPVLLIRPLLHTMIVYPMTGLPRGSTVVPFILILYAANILGLNFGLLISSLGLRQKETLTIMVLFFIFFDLYGGFFVSKFPPGLKWGKFASPFFLFFVLLVHSLFKYKNLRCETALAMKQCANVPKGGTLDVDIILDVIKADISYYWFIIIIIGASIVINFLTFFILRKTITKPATGFTFCEACKPINTITKKYKKPSISLLP